MRALQDEGRSERRACSFVGCVRSILHYRKRKVDCDAQILAQMKTLIERRRRFGYRRLHVLQCKEGPPIGRDHFYRIYRAAGLQVRRRPKRHATYLRSGPAPAAQSPNERWSVDFVQDSLASGRQFRSLTIIDDCTRQCLAIEVDFSLPTARVLRTFEAIIVRRGKPGTIRFDNGPEFTSLAMLKWGATNGIQLHFIDPGKPVQNCSIESFNGRFREECLSEQFFPSLGVAQDEIALWREDYNQERPHTSLGLKSPDQYFAENYNPKSHLCVA